MFRSLRMRLTTLTLVGSGVLIGFIAACTRTAPEIPAVAATDESTKQPAEAPAAEGDATEQEIRLALAAYIEAFNNHDAEALSQSWAEDAVYIDRETGERVEGRDALVEDFSDIFQNAPNIRLVGRVLRVDLLTPQVAQVEGQATVTRDDNEHAASFTAIFVREGDNWHIRSVQEANLPMPTSPATALADLEWLLGHWVDDADENITIDTVVRWAPGGAFMVRAYTATGPEGVVREGTQVIGWDSRSQEIRSWAFNSDGSFGDGVWSQVGDAWYVKSTQTLADGSAASGTFVMTPVDNDTMTMQVIGHEIEGEPQPSSEIITITRAPTTDESTDTASAPATEE